MERTVFQALFCREYMIAQWSTSTVIRHLRQLQEPSKCPFFHNHRCGKWSERKPPSVFSNLSSRIWNFPPSCCPATASMNMPFPDRCWQPRWPRRRHSAASGTRHKGHGHGDGTRRSRRFVGMKKKRNKLQKNRTRPCATVEMEMEPSRPTRWDNHLCKINVGSADSQNKNLYYLLLLFYGFRDTTLCHITSFPSRWMFLSSFNFRKALPPWNSRNTLRNTPKPVANSNVHHSHPTIFCDKAS